MGRNGGCDYSQLEDFLKRLDKQDDMIAKFIEGCAKELAARLLAKVIKRTPVGQYPSSAGKVGGTLSRGWTGGKTSSGTAYARNLKVNHYGGAYVIEIVNPVEYASYVEYGHRTRNHRDWADGYFMLTISEKKIQSIAPALLEKKIAKQLGDVFGGDK